MAVKLAVVMLAALTVVTGNSSQQLFSQLSSSLYSQAYSEKAKRQSGSPDLSEYFNQFQEQMKPITGQFPSLPSGQFPSLPNGQLPSLPNGFGSFPSFPSMGGSSGSSGSNSQNKRQANPNTISEWFNQFQETGNNLSGNLPFKPSFGQFPFPGSSSGSSETSENQNQ